jgi:trehalose 6-phosphate synthase/phosphatase
MENTTGVDQRSAFRWIGWPGNMSSSVSRFLVEERFREHLCKPVFLDDWLVQRAYSGFCNQTLWPLFHEFPGRAKYAHEWWTAYVSYNHEFARIVLETIQSNELLWIHDYHLMLLPAILRKYRADLPIGFFLHIPFPSRRYLELLPDSWRAEILSGLLGSDLVGFHVPDYQNNFLRCVAHTKAVANGSTIHWNGRTIATGSFPIGIDCDKYVRVAASNGVMLAGQSIREQVRGRKIILSVSRLDQTKGILEALRGFLEFLNLYPEWRERVTLLLLVAPSRMDLIGNIQLERAIENLVGYISGRYGTLEWRPVIYLRQISDFTHMVALYCASDIALVNSLMDGMNLISKEFVASRIDHEGVLILSKTTGSARELTEAILVNPFDQTELAHGIAQAAEMPIDEQKIRICRMQARLRDQDILHWGNQFLETLASAFDHANTSIDA